MSLFPSKPTPMPDVLEGSEFSTLDIAGFLLEDFQTFNPEGYCVLYHFGNSIPTTFYPGSGTIVLNSHYQSQLLNNFNNMIPNVAKDLGITENQSVKVVGKFFEDKTIVVQPTGIQGRVYRTMQGIQNYVPMTFMTQAVTNAKTLGLTGTKIITQAPLSFVGATYVGSVFFAYVGTVAGNNTVGTVFNSTSFVLSLPMKGVEMVLNGLILRPVSQATGLPMILNATSELTSGMGIKLTEYTKIGASFERIINTRFVKKAQAIYKTIKNDQDL